MAIPSSRGPTKELWTFKFNVALRPQRGLFGRGAQDGHLHFHTAPDLWAVDSFFLSFFHGAIRPQKPYGLLGTGEEWDRECRAYGLFQFKCCFTSTETIRIISDGELWAMAALSFMVLYVHRNRMAYRGQEWDRECRAYGLFEFKSCFTSTETIRTIRDGEPRTASSTFPQFLSPGLWPLFLSWCYTSTETVWLRRDGARMRYGLRVLAHTLSIQLLSSVRATACSSSVLLFVHRDQGRRAQNGHLDFHTPREL